MDVYEMTADWEVYVPSTPHKEKMERRPDWLEEMARKYGMIPAPGKRYGVSTIMRYLLPDLFTNEHNTWRHIKNRPYDMLEEFGFFNFENCWRFKVLVNVSGYKRKNRRIATEVWIDKSGRGPKKARYGDPEHAKRALLNRLPGGSEATLIQD